MTSAELLALQLVQLRSAERPEQIVAMATGALETLRVVQQAVSEARDAAVLDLHEASWSLNEIARAVGMTRGRVFQIVQRGRASE